MLCQICQKNPASVHLTEITHFPVEPPPGGEPVIAPSNGDAETAGDSPVFEEKHICDTCAQREKVPFSAVSTNKGLAFIQLIQETAKRARAEKSIACPECGMSLAEFRNTGRLGCPRDYDVFKEHVTPLLLRIHNATSHRGRLPGQDPEELERQHHLSTLREQLDQAIRAEQYESAARLRDEIQILETRSGEDA